MHKVTIQCWQRKTASWADGTVAALLLIISVVSPLPVHFPEHLLCKKLLQAIATFLTLPQHTVIDSNDRFYSVY